MCKIKSKHASSQGTVNVLHRIYQKIYWVVVIRAECKQEKIYCYKTPIALNF